MSPAAQFIFLYFYTSTLSKFLPQIHCACLQPDRTGTIISATACSFSNQADCVSLKAFFFCQDCAEASTPKKPSWPNLKLEISHMTVKLEIWPAMINNKNNTINREPTTWHMTRQTPTATTNWMTENNNRKWCENHTGMTHWKVANMLALFPQWLRSGESQKTCSINIKTQSKPNKAKQRQFET